MSADSAAQVSEVYRASILALNFGGNTDPGDCVLLRATPPEEAHAVILRGNPTQRIDG